MTAEAFAHHDWLHFMSRRQRPDRRSARIDELERLVAIGQAARGRGPFTEPPFGGGRGRKRRGDVRVALLLLLAEEPRNGYQLMQEIEERSGGRWRPSPGSVYPTLQQLEDEGLIHAIERNGTKLFELTDEGRKHIDQAHTPPWEADDETEGTDDMKREIKQLHIAAMMVLRAGDERQIARAARLLADARRDVYKILAEDLDD
jgi:DNA-binding PadR family transcriptional regulator